MTSDPTVTETLARRRPIRERVDLADAPDAEALAEKLAREAASFLSRRPAEEPERTRVL
jgi:hypothetical protein